MICYQKQKHRLFLIFTRLILFYDETNQVCNTRTTLVNPKKNHSEFTKSIPVKNVEDISNSGNNMKVVES